MIRKWLPAIVILGLVALHFQNQTTQAKPSKQRSDNQNAIGDVVEVVEGSVYDGDTLRVRKGNQIIKARFCGIDAPEKAQPLGIRSRDTLRSLVGNGSVRIVAVERDRYGRTIAELFTLDGQSINAAIVRQGMAYHYAKYSGNCPSRDAIVQAEVEAQTERVGVWRGSHQKPWDYRKMRR